MTKSVFICVNPWLQNNAGVAQLAEQRFRKPQVGGSNPPTGF